MCQARGCLRKSCFAIFGETHDPSSNKAGPHQRWTGTIKDVFSSVSCRQRGEDRAVPGLAKRSAVGVEERYLATLSKRHTRYVMLANVAIRNPDGRIPAAHQQGKTLPSDCIGGR